MMAMIGSPLPETIILCKVFKPPLIDVFLIVVGLGMLLVGYILNVLPLSSLVSASNETGATPSIVRCL